MSTHTVDWMALRFPGAEDTVPGGLRERRKRATRQLLVDTAIEMFLERGFDRVTVAEIAQVCQVSPTTVFNYFPTKEQLVLDLPDDLLKALADTLADPTATPVEGMLSILDGELDYLIGWLRAQQDYAWAVDAVQRFEAMVRDTPALRAHHRHMLATMAETACRALADRTGLSSRDPEPRIAAAALLGLWSIQVSSSCEHLVADKTPDEVRAEVAAEVRRAAALLDAGLSAFATGNRDTARRPSSAGPAVP